MFVESVRGRKRRQGCVCATFENVATLAKTSDDVGIVQNALDAMKAFLRAAKGEAILSWGGSDPSSVSRAYLDACATSLQPHCEEGAALFVAPLLGQMIRRLPSIIGPMIPEMCDAVCARLQTATRPMLIASLLCIFARLAHVDANALVTLLASREIQPSSENENSKTQLEFVLKKWCEGQPDVHGRFDVKLTSTALGLILATQHPTLIDGSIVLKGRPIEVELPREQSERDLERSKPVPNSSRKSPRLRKSSVSSRIPWPKRKSWKLTSGKKTTAVVA